MTITATITLDRDELLNILRLVEWRIQEHETAMRDIAPEGYIECGTVEDYEAAKAKAEALEPLRRKLREAEEASRKPFDPADFCGMTFED